MTSSTVTLLANPELSNNQDNMHTCACGCGQQIGLLDSQGRPHKFRQGHNSRGSNNSQWKGDNVGNKGLHNWVRRHLPEPELCEMCNTKPSYDLANITGIYNREFHNWKYLCRKCHFWFDDRINKIVLFKEKDMSDRSCKQCGSTESYSSGRKHWSGYEEHKLSLKSWFLCYKCHTFFRNFIRSLFSE